MVVLCMHVKPLVSFNIEEQCYCHTFQKSKQELLEVSPGARTGHLRFIV